MLTEDTMQDAGQHLIVKPPVPLLLAAVVVGGLFYVLGQYVSVRQARIAEKELTVQGTGKALQKPDVARLTLGVQTNVRPNAREALDIANRTFTAVQRAVRAAGVSEGDVRTTDLSINPQYDYPNGRTVLRGFQASASLVVSIRDLTKIGDVLSRATAEGANVAGAITFAVDDPDALRREAEQKAVENVKKNAAALASALGVRLGPVRSVVTTIEPPDGQLAIYASPPYGAGGGGPSVPPGSHELTVTISVKYGLR